MTETTRAYVLDTKRPAHTFHVEYHAGEYEKARHVPRFLISTASAEFYGCWTCSISSVTRTDAAGSTARPLLYIRTDVTPAATTDQITTFLPPGGAGSYYIGGATAGTGLNGQYTLHTAQSTAGGKTTGAWGGSAPSTGYYGICLGVQYRSRVGRIMTVMFIGDSITQGAGSTTGASWVEYSADNVNLTGAGGSLSAISITPVERMKVAYSGTAPVHFNAFLKYMTADGLLPNVIVYAAFSPNAVASTTYLTNYQYTTDALARCDNGNIYPLIWRGLPCGGANITTAAQDGYRLQENLDMVYMDANLIDFVAPFNSTGNPITMTASLTSDGVHPNNAGNTLIGVSVGTSLQTLATAYFAGVTT